MAKNLMIQGTMSGVGKSILTAGLLRVFRQDGMKVAPFKSQNMALNSFVTPDGREIGRAQALQAMAAGVMPSSDMNPILLKPSGNTTSQVIVEGLPVGDMRAADYFRDKKKYIPTILNAYNRLSKENDIVVIEGAGSPVEINLRENDIVNMGLAELVDSPVVLVGDIDPGGVFAQLLGTVQLLSGRERDRVKALVINKFRGDIDLLTPGLDMFRNYCDIPFAGVIPYGEFTLDEEDSLSERLNVREGFDKKDSGDIRIAVIRFPFISNYTDFAVFEDLPGVEMIYTENAAAISDADIVILPGTKNTLMDYRWLVDKKIADAVKKAGDSGKLIVGICGGFQMLGRTISGREISDISNESSNTTEGLGLLPVDTRFLQDKTLRQVEGKIEGLRGSFAGLNGSSFKGYEIHMGSSTFHGQVSYQSEMIVENGNVFGTYIHGIFDTGEVAEKLLMCAFRGRRGKEGEFLVPDLCEKREKELDKLADIVRNNIDMKMIYRIIGYGD